MGRKDLFDSDSDSDDGELARDLAAAAERERRRNPHAELRATQPRTNRLERRPAPATGGAATAVPKPPKKVDLFASSDSDAEEAGDDDAKKTQQRHVKKADAPVEAKPTKKKEKEVKEVADSTNDESEGSHKAGKARSSKGNERAQKDDAEESEEGSGLHINAQYAAKFEQVKRKQELQRLTEKYGKRLASVTATGDDSDADDDEEDEEDDEAVLLTAENELAFAKALLAVRKAAAAAKAKKKEAAEKEAYLQQRYFPPTEEQLQRNTEVFQKAVERKKEQRTGKSFTLADEYRRAVKTSAEDGVDDAEGGENGTDNSGLRKLRPQTEEERRLRDSFLRTVAESTEAFSVAKKDVQAAAAARGAGEEGEEEGEEKVAARRLMQEAFSIATPHSNGDEEVEDTAATADDADGADEVFIRDFFTRELWRPENNPGVDSDGDDVNDAMHHHQHGSTLAQLAQEEEDEAFYNDAEVWEREYQERKYRHEEAEEEASHVQTFARPIGEAAAGLLRKQDTSRHDARQRRRERVEAARQQQLEELKRLKHLKRQEIDEQRALIAAVAGLTKSKSGTAVAAMENEDGKPVFGDDDEEDRALARLKEVWSEKDLAADYDPVEFDRKMAMLFNDDYYDEKNVDEDEVAFLEGELDQVGEMVGEKDNDGAAAASSSSSLLSSASDNDASGEEDEDEDEDDDDVDPQGTRSRQAKKRSALAAALVEEPDLFQAASLEEAKRKALTHANAKAGETGAITRASSASAAAGEAKKKKQKAQKGSAADVNDSVLFNDPFTGGGGSSAGVSDDPLALLYPSASLKHLEDEAFQRRQELEALIADKQSGEDEDKEAVLARLKAELKQKEEEYYRLHHESTLDGGEIKTRFRYREVPVEDFTLSIEDILARDDRQLNMIAPMNCYAAYLDKAANERDRRRIERRRLKGFREVDPTRSSRRYGEVSKTVVLDPTMNEEEGLQVAERLRKRLREEGAEDGEVADAPSHQRTATGDARGGGAGAAPHRPPFGSASPHHPRADRGGRGRGGAPPSSWRGGSRGRGGADGASFRGRGGRGGGGGGGGQGFQPFRGSGGRGRGAGFRGRGQ